MLGPGGGALRSSEVYTSIYRQMSIILYLICDTGRSRTGVGSRGRSPGSSGVLGNKLRSDEHIFIPYLLHCLSRQFDFIH